MRTTLVVAGLAAGFGVAAGWFLHRPGEAAPVVASADAGVSAVTDARVADKADCMAAITGWRELHVTPPAPAPTPGKHPAEVPVQPAPVTIYVPEFSVSAGSNGLAASRNDVEAAASAVVGGNQGVAEKRFLIGPEAGLRHSPGGNAAMLGGRLGYQGDTWGVGATVLVNPSNASVDWLVSGGAWLRF